VAELEAGVQAVALAGGGATAHAAIVARSLGVPMVAGLGAEALELAEGELVVVDGGAGAVLVGAGSETLDAARAAVRNRRTALERAAGRRDVPAQTSDGRRIAVLANVAGQAELHVAFGSGAEGVGLLRTELAFLDSRSWPTEEQHRRALEPVLRRLGGRPATVRVLDFGGDKLPPCVGAAQERGITLLLRHPEALDAQLRAILRAAGDATVRVLVPLVQSPGELDACASALRRAAEAVGVPAPALGPMVETPAAAAAARALARRADFLSIGTNDLTAATLGFDRFAGSGGAAHDPRVLREVARTVAAAHEARIAVEVCGEAAGDPIMLPLLVGLGVDELSVGASRVGIVREWVRGLSFAEAAELADRALECACAEEVGLLVAPLARRLECVERGDAQPVRG
jgi:phosphoenolpyruvate-protein kinase (PTS system EI component)